MLGEVTTGYNGYAVLEGLEPQTVLVTEIKSPDGFVLDSTAHPVAHDESFPPILRFETLEIHKVFLRVPNLVLTKNLSPFALADGIKASKGGQRDRSALGGCDL